MVNETEKVVRKNPDYTNSAVNLCNPPEVIVTLSRLAIRRAYLSDLNEKVKAFIPEELKAKIAETEKAIAELNEDIRKDIDAYGSYQDLELGSYAVKCAKKSKVYHVEPFKEHYPQHVTSVIVETINSKVLDGFIKGVVIQEADLRMHKVITEDVTYSYIVK